MDAKEVKQAPAELYLTFEDGLHVGVFQDAPRAEALNALRRNKLGVEPDTVRYVRGDMADATAKQFVDMKAFADATEIKLEEARKTIDEQQRAYRPDGDATELLRKQMYLCRKMTEERDAALGRLSRSQEAFRTMLKGIDHCVNGPIKVESELVCDLEDVLFGDVVEKPEREQCPYCSGRVGEWHLSNCRLHGFVKAGVSAVVVERQAPKHVHEFFGEPIGTCQCGAKLVPAEWSIEMELPGAQKATAHHLHDWIEVTTMQDSADGVRKFECQCGQARDECPSCGQPKKWCTCAESSGGPPR